MGLIERRIKYASDVFSALCHKAEWDIDTACAFLEEIPDAKPIDPVHYAGGCYCRDCEYLTETPWPGSRVYECTWAHQSTTLDDWCSHGRRDDFKEGAL